MAALVIWAVIVAAVARLAIRPLEELTRRATVQRDLTVTLAEAERVRLAADLHDGPLQDLTLTGPPPGRKRRHGGGRARAVDRRGAAGRDR